MDPQLIAHWLFELNTYAWVIDPGAWLIILKVAFGLGMVIFVHELGHFGVAKLCGVQCDKFYLGFDIGGWKFCKFKWGETEYGIGILPLGGYVKMLGQEDNPARLKEELERAKAAQASGDKAEKTGEDSGEEPVDIEAVEQALYNPRSYLAQSVPKRMAIISAGVIMNIIFAFICAVGAFYMGVTQTACVVGQVQPGGPAWQSGFQSGDRIVSIADKKAHSFRDLLSGVTLGDNGSGVTMMVVRPGKDEPQPITVTPELSGGLFPTIGVASSFTTVLTGSVKRGQSPTIPGSVASRAEPPFEAGDKVVDIDGVAVESYADIRRALARSSDKAVEVVVERPNGSDTDKNEKQPAGDNVKRVSINVPAQPMKCFGLQMSMGPVLAVKSDSPAAAAGVRPGDVITTIDGEPVGDPLTLAARLRKLAPKTIAIEVDRDGKTVSLSAKLSSADVDVEPIRPGGAVAAPELGIAYDVLNTVDAVEKGSPAEKAGIEPGAVIASATVILPDDETLKDMGYDNVFDKSVASEPIEFSAEEPNWAFFFYRIVQDLPPQSRVEFVLSDGGKVTLDLQDSKDWFSTDRGFIFDPLTVLRQAESFGDAVTLGAVEAYESATKVFVFLQKLTSGQISPRALGGPVAIAKTAGHEASRGTAELLLFLTLLSANLAVINFLPIPVLDGGHMVFLAYEGIRGKPADERIQLLLSYIGLILILSLMIFVVGLDFNIIPRK